ncbi:MAG: carbohydrate porin [Chthoniobacterales bacterium]
MNARRAGMQALLLAVIGLHAATAQILPDGRSGHISPFRGGQTTYMFRWDIPPDAYFNKSWLQQPQALGSPFGLRSDALDHGITLAGTYTSYTMGNVTGGQSTGAAYLDMLFASAIIDFGKLCGWNGWSLALSVRQTDGSFIGDIVGTTPITSPAPEPNRSFRFGEMMLSWEGLDRTVQLSAGRLILNNAFAQIPQSSLFLNSALSGYPGSLATDITFSGTNSARWGAMLRYQPIESLYLLTGTFSAAAGLGDNNTHGLDFSLPPQSGTVSVAEIGFLTGHYSSQPGIASPIGAETWFGGMPGAYKVGGIVSTAPFEQFTTGNMVYGNWGMYATAEQMVYAEHGGGPEEGLSLFGTFTYFQQDRNEVPWFFSGGAFYQGLLPGRPRDQCGAAFSCALFSRSLRHASEADGEPGQTNEMALELAYSVSLTPWAYITPDLRVLVNPGATGNPTSVVVGIETGISF